MNINWRLHTFFSFIAALICFFVLYAVDDLFTTKLIACSLVFFASIFTLPLQKTFGQESSPSQTPADTLNKRPTPKPAKSNPGQTIATLYIGNLPYKANEEAVKQFCQDFVEVVSVRLMKDKRTGKRKGYGFLEVNCSDVEEVINVLNEKQFHDRTIKVRSAKDKPE